MFFENMADHQSTSHHITEESILTLTAMITPDLTCQHLPACKKSFKSSQLPFLHCTALHCAQPLLLTELYPCGVHPVAVQIYLRSQLRIYWCYFFLSVHNMFRPLKAIFRWNTITSLTYFEKAIDITTDPLFHNLSLIIHFTIHTMAK
jgi:hypothetical protein